MSYNEKHKEEQKQINRVRALEYYYKNLEKRREYNRNYWKTNFCELYKKRLIKSSYNLLQIKNIKSIIMKKQNMRTKQLLKMFIIYA